VGPIVPIIMKIWTTSYGLTSAGWACLMFFLFYCAVDLRDHRKWTLPLVVIGSNAVLTDMFASIVPLPHWVSIFARGMAANIQPWVHAAVVLMVEWLILFWMYRNRTLIKA
jgi:predicted acyltransferase